MATAPTAPHVPPQNLEAEESLLGALMVSQASIDPVLLEVRLKSEDFYREQHRTVYTAILELHEKSRPIDALTVSESLAQAGTLDQVGGKDMVSSLAATAPAPGNARHYAEIVRQNALLRRLIAAAQTIQQSVTGREGEPKELADRAEQLLFRVAHDERASDFREIGEILSDEVDRLEALSKGDAELTGTPSGFRDLDSITGGFQPGNLIIIAARPAMGKCLGGECLIHDPRTGARRKIEDLVAAHEHGDEVWVSAVGPDLKLWPVRVSNAFRSGRQKLFRLRTRLGRTIDSTANHPFLTIAGWQRLDQLASGSRIGVPRALPQGEPTEHFEDQELVVLAALIADGNLRTKTPVYCFGPDSFVRDEVEAAVRKFGLRFSSGVERGSAYLSNGRGSKTNPITGLLERHGLMGKLSADKFVPTALFGCSNAQIARFLSVLFACDGHVYASHRLSQIGYTTISERLARDVQHLLLRLGIVSCIRTLKRDVYEGTDTVAREVRITGQESLGRFVELIPVCGKGAKLTAIAERLAASTSMTNVDTAPSAVWNHVLEAKGERPWSKVSLAAGYSPNHNWHVGTRGLSRGRLRQLSAVLEAPELELLAESEIWWDEVLEIEELGVEETYDLTVPEHHSFVANDLIVHNSSLVCNIAENVAVKHDKAVGLFSLEMSEAELSHRFIASQARINGDKLRKGKVKSEWPKVISAANVLSKAPLWIDDSADLSLLELRAKARRLHGQAGEKLGLIIVDYIQLMRAEDPRMNRVEQVGQISRGLKILAQEIGVPVIGLSQLSRAPEQRSPARPILSDLRESGNIEQDADLVSFIYRDEYYNPETEDQGIAELNIAKHRNGPIGQVRLVFLPHYPKFADMAHGEKPVEQRAGEEASTSLDEEPSSNGSGGEEDDGFEIAEEF